MLFKEESGKESESQIPAFDDTWHWGEQAEEIYAELVTEINGKVGQMISALRGAIGENQMMAYLVMMAGRLVQLHRVLKPTGSLYLHCDPTASHYLKIILDTIFGPQNFVNEIVWKRTSTVKGNAGQGSKTFGPNTDTILFYRKTENNTFNPVFLPYRDEYLKKFYKYTEPDDRRYRLISMIGPGGAAKGNPQYEVMGITRYWRYSKQKMQGLIDTGLVVQTRPGAVPLRKQYLDEGHGVSTQSLWDDIEALAPTAAERLGYPTQKPLILLERILLASSNPGDLVLDPFCGCGTTVAAAQKLGRRWIGIDITHLAITLQKYRLQEMFPGLTFDVIGEPKDLGAARQLAADDRFQFQWWALSLVKARPLGGDAGSKIGKKGADKGVDGIITFLDDTKKANQVIVQVKSGHVTSQTIRDLRGTIEREKAAIGVLITLEPPTRDMTTEAVSAGFYTPTWWEPCPRIQIFTVEQLLHDARVKMPPAHGTFKQAQKVTKEEGVQGSLNLGA